MLQHLRKKWQPVSGTRQIALSIDPEEAARIHSRTGQHPGNNVPCTMCGGACVYVMLPQQRKYDKDKPLSEIQKKPNPT